MTSDWFGRGFRSSVSVARRRLNLLVGSALHDAGEFAVVEFATSGFNLVEHLGNLGLGESVGLDTTVAEESLHGIESDLIGGLAQILGIESDQVGSLQNGVSVFVDHVEDLLELLDLSLIEHLEGLGVGALVRRFGLFKSS